MSGKMCEFSQIRTRTFVLLICSSMYLINDSQNKRMRESKVRKLFVDVSCKHVCSRESSCNEMSNKNLTKINSKGCSSTYVQSRAINFDRQGHFLTQLKMLHCKTVVNIITYHHVV
jgi:hypothetical protein